MKEQIPKKGIFNPLHITNPLLNIPPFLLITKYFLSFNFGLFPLGLHESQNLIKLTR